MSLCLNRNTRALLDVLVLQYFSNQQWTKYHHWSMFFFETRMERCLNWCGVFGVMIGRIEAFPPGQKRVFLNYPPVAPSLRKQHVLCYYMRGKVKIQKCCLSLRQCFKISTWKQPLSTAIKLQHANLQVLNNFKYCNKHFTLNIFYIFA